MKQFLFCIFILTSFFSFSQTTSELSQLRETFQQLQVLSPSPEMSSMIRFDNVEVSPYTGVPNINIPLFDLHCTRDLNFSMVLKYHPDAIKKEERAGSTGLGWSLFAGGSITRVVRGLPDESRSTSIKPAFGLYQPGNIPNGNDLDDFLNNQNTVVGATDGLTIYDKMFEALESANFDTQYDLYYYNFMGYSGSFYVKLNNSSGITIVKLEEDALKISARVENFDAADPTDPNRFQIAGFTIHDENGNKFFFDVKELSWTTKGYKSMKMFKSSNVWEMVNDNIGSISTGEDNRSIVTAYHLSTVTPYTYTSPILTFTYGDYSESYKDITLVKNKLLSSEPSMTDESYSNYIQSQISLATLSGWEKIRTQFGNKTAAYHNLTTTISKKLKSINYNDKLFFDFTYETGRLDMNYLTNNDLVKLSNIKISSADLSKFGSLQLRSNEKVLKQFKLNYSQTSYDKRKLLLKEVVEYKNAVTDPISKKYRLSYNSENSYLPVLYEDGWGYPTDINPEDEDKNYTTNIGYMKVFVLEKMEVPTGGCIIYHYEPHTYSYVGNQKLYSNELLNIRKNEIGGGIRIKNIGFFDDKNVAQNYYAQNLSTPIASKEITYDYNENTSQSSGSLSFAQPVFRYNRLYQLFGEFQDRYHNSGLVNLQPNKMDTFKYEITTNYNNLMALTTKGSRIGYKNVKITERDNGKKELTFTSPIDFPEENYTTTYPFIPSKNVDYKRGLLLNEKNYDSSNTLISEIKNTYAYSESEVNTGLIPFYRYNINCKKTVCSERAWLRADLINTNLVSCHNGAPSLLSPDQYYQDIPTCTSTTDLMNYKIEKRVVGWAKLTNSERIDYLPSAVNDVTEYTYNSINKKPGSVKKTIGSDTYLTEYEYLNTSAPTGTILFPNQYNRIADIKMVTTKRNNELLATENITFKDIQPNAGGIISAGSNIYVPEKYQYAKGTNTLEDLQTITRLDDRGNPLEVKMADGTYNTFIWGYNKTRLIAIIENCQFSEIENLPVYSTLLSQTYGTSSNAVTVSQLLSSFASLRSNLSITKKMTSIVYEFGKGIVCKTDANGKSVYYNYNDLGNLQEIRDNDNNLLKQYFESYKN